MPPPIRIRSPTAQSPSKRSKSPQRAYRFRKWIDGHGALPHTPHRKLLKKVSMNFQNFSNSKKANLRFILICTERKLYCGKENLNLFIACPHHGNCTDRIGFIRRTRLPRHVPYESVRLNYNVHGRPQLRPPVLYISFIKPSHQSVTSFVNPYITDWAYDKL